MKKLFVAFSLCLLLMSCVSTTQGTKPNICETNTAPSFLCEVAEAHGVTLEEVGVILIVANAVAIGEGAYSVEDAIEVLTKLRDVLENPVSYMFFRYRIEKALHNYPALFTVAEVYLDAIASPQIMHRFDRALLKSWLNQRIRDLTPHAGHTGMIGGADL